MAKAARPTPKAIDPPPPLEGEREGFKPPATLTVVVLRFADGLVVDLVAELSPDAAIGAVAERAIRAGRPLPLLDAVASLLPYERLMQLVGPPPAPAVAPPRPAIPIGGAVHAIAAYVRATTEAAKPAVYTARGALKDFFARYDCPVDFAGEPEGKEETKDEPGSRKAV